MKHIEEYIEKSFDDWVKIHSITRAKFKDLYIEEFGSAFNVQYFYYLVRRSAKNKGYELKSSTGRINGIATGLFKFIKIQQVPIQQEQIAFNIRAKYTQKSNNSFFKNVTHTITISLENGSLFVTHCNNSQNLSKIPFIPEHWITIA